MWRRGRQRPPPPWRGRRRAVVWRSALHEDQQARVLDGSGRRALAAANCARPAPPFAQSCSSHWLLKQPRPKNAVHSALDVVSMPSGAHIRPHPPCRSMPAPARHADAMHLEVAQSMRNRWR